MDAGALGAAGAAGLADTWPILGNYSDVRMGGGGYADVAMPSPYGGVDGAMPGGGSGYDVAMPGRGAHPDALAHLLRLAGGR